MLLVSANVNGIRAAARRGGLAWLAARDADVVTLQEVRADDSQLRSALADGGFGDWHVAHAPGSAKGRAGVAVLSRHPLKDVRASLAGEFDDQGRWVEADVLVDGEVVTVASAYVHTGEARTPRQEEKERFLGAVGDRVGEWAADGRLAVLTGDLNVAHTADDLKNWKGNRGKAGFLPAEQAHLDRWAAEHGLVDVTRRLHGPGPGPYSWWSWRGQAFDNDSGWRIDYQLATAPLAERAVSGSIGRADSYAERWSDHAAVLVDYAL
ncbi:exodeoxyribonuclease III [Phycicoccus sonneratiae]|uniref:Endonuclease/exonuclease/phosphatase family protein n=1 Tax=Phycicoccus sonneratiae TaxID=2807628 RepID=A0ABS2CPW9_9MICO|nr:exodeoxyribonuclease III [Phycicoccus sonneraticus]MBM6401094.1 endonuclease/exonuclease/phosphatase family protein [Phycicoccus sonneraticus]